MGVKGLIDYVISCMWELQVIQVWTWFVLHCYVIGKEKEINDKKKTNKHKPGKEKMHDREKIFSVWKSQHNSYYQIGDDLKLFHIVQMNVWKYIIKLLSPSLMY